MDFNTLRFCSCCQCTMLALFFHTNRKGELYKTCDACILKSNKQYKKNQLIKKYYHKAKNYYN